MSETDLTSTTTNNSTITATINASIASRVPDYVNNHIVDTNNPHSVTCEQIGAQEKDPNIVIDSSYVHTDNNFTDSHKEVVDNLIDTVDELNTKLNDFASNAEEIATTQEAINERFDEINKTIEEADFDTFVKKTDYATAESVGVGLSSSNYGVHCNPENNFWQISPASEEEISAQENSFKPIVPSNLSSAIKAGFCNSNVEWSDEEKDSAKNLLGIGAISGYQENLLINQEFKINQKGQTLYEGSGKSVNSQIVCDRWFKDKYTEVGYNSDSNLYIKNTSATTQYGFGQFILNHDKLLGKNLTFWLSCENQDYTYTFSPLPTDTSILEKNTVLESFETDFGFIRLEWRKSHFIVNIVLNPSATLTIYRAKLEIGTTFTGFKEKEYHTELLECLPYLQGPFSRYQWVPVCCTRTKTETIYDIVMTLYPMIKSPKLLVNNANKEIQVIELDGTSAKKTFNTYGDGDLTINGCNKCISFSIYEDNAELLGDNTSLNYWSMLKTYDIFFEAEVSE